MPAGFVSDDPCLERGDVEVLQCAVEWESGSIEMGDGH